MIRRIRTTQYIEEILGAFGFLYIAGIIIVSVFLVRFLVQATFSSIVTASKETRIPPPTFAIEAAEKALER